MYRVLLEAWKKQRAVILLILAAIIGLPILATQGVASRPNRLNSSPTPAPLYSGVTLPDGYREHYVHYAIIERPDGTVRHVFVNPEAIDALKRGYSLPNGTTIVIEGYYALKDGKGGYQMDAEGHYREGEPFEMIHVRQKRGDWKDSDFVSEARAGNWNFGSFDTQTGKPFDESISACFNCHNASEQPELVFTFQELLGYQFYGELQYFTCNLTGRTPCR